MSNVNVEAILYTFHNKQAIVFFSFNYYVIIDIKTRYYNPLKEEGMSMYECNK